MAMQQILEEGKNISRILSCRTFFSIFMDKMLLSFSSIQYAARFYGKIPQRNLLSM